MPREIEYDLDASKDLAARLAWETAEAHGVYSGHEDERSAPYVVMSFKKGLREGRGLPLFTLEVL